MLITKQPKNKTVAAIVMMAVATLKILVTVVAAAVIIMADLVAAPIKPLSYR
jgi:hypothetical protein